MAANHFTVFTSIAPHTKRVFDGGNHGQAYQRACIDSWIKAGADVVSINSDPEIALLCKHEFPVRYISSSNDRPTIREFLSAASRASTDLVGIINADCLIFNYESSLIPTIWAGAAEGLVLAERVNIDPVALRPTGQTCLGFDAMFFNKVVASKIQIDDELAVGQPWWDYWLPLEFASSGIRLHKLQFPMIFHLDHEQGWSHLRWLYFGRKLLNHFSGRGGTMVPSFSTGIKDFTAYAERDDLGGFADWCFNWLRENATPVSILEQSGVAKLHTQMMNWVTDFDGMHASTILLADAKREISRLAAIAETIDLLREGQAETERYARHLEKNIDAQKEALAASDVYAKNLENDVRLLREAHTQAERYARHLEVEIEAQLVVKKNLEPELDGTKAVFEKMIGSLESQLNDLRKAHADAESHVRFQDAELERLKNPAQLWKRLMLKAPTMPRWLSVQTRRCR